MFSKFVLIFILLLSNLDAKKLYYGAWQWGYDKATGDLFFDSNIDIDKVTIELKDRTIYSYYNNKECGKKRIYKGLTNIKKYKTLNQI